MDFFVGKARFVSRFGIQSSTMPETVTAPAPRAGLARRIQSPSPAGLSSQGAVAGSSGRRSLPRVVRCRGHADAEGLRVGEPFALELRHQGELAGGLVRRLARAGFGDGVDDDAERLLRGEGRGDGEGEGGYRARKRAFTAGRRPRA